MKGVVARDEWALPPELVYFKSTVIVSLLLWAGISLRSAVWTKRIQCSWGVCVCVLPKSVRKICTHSWPTLRLIPRRAFMLRTATEGKPSGHAQNSALSKQCRVTCGKRNQWLQDSVSTLWTLQVAKNKTKIEQAKTNKRIISFFFSFSHIQCQCFNTWFCFAFLREVLIWTISLVWSQMFRLTSTNILSLLFLCSWGFI